MLRHSKKRDQIIEVFKHGGLLTANEVYEQVQDLDKATVYRNLSLLTSEGYLREVHIRKGMASYELNREHDYHQHFICNTCEKVTPVEIKIEELKEILPKEITFDEFELNLKGTCTNC